MEKAYLIGVHSLKNKKWESLESLDELESLAKTAGVEVIESLIVDIRAITAATFIGKGKVEELKPVIKELEIDIVIFDVELNPSQNRNLEEAFCVRVIDRTGIILDIFALHAKSKEGKLQVELAQYQYLYPRLKGAWTHLSKQRGGSVGLRGPGETQLEVDRRLVKDRVARLKKSLRKVESSRDLHRKKRKETPIPTMSLVGYTNAGKSTLFNLITQSQEIAEDKLFATLDPKTKKISLPSGREVLLTDTVGFIRNLPHELVEAFMSTFEEARQSELLLHVVDGSHPYALDRFKIVLKVIEELGFQEMPIIHVINKMDIATQKLELDEKNCVYISAAKNEGIDELFKEVERVLSQTMEWMTLFLKHPYGNKLSNLYLHGQVYQVENLEDGVQVDVALPKKWANMYRGDGVNNTQVSGRKLIK